MHFPPLHLILSQSAIPDSTRGYSRRLTSFFLNGLRTVLSNSRRLFLSSSLHSLSIQRFAFGFIGQQIMPAQIIQTVRQFCRR